MNIIQQSLYIPYRQGQLHLRQIKAVDADMSKPPILMLHGAMSNGRVFYSDKGKGLGCYLAKAGYVVYVLDTLGRGLSTPTLSAGARHGQGEVIREQLPLVQHYILSVHRGAARVHWCAHSWGGVLMASAIARFDFFQTSVASLLTFGSKRAIKVRSLKKWLMVDLAWNRLAPAIAKGHGYLAADRWRMGMDNESQASLAQSIDWVRGDWIDHDDGFDYAQAALKLAQGVGWPRSWFIAALGDQVLGHPSDVQRMIAECHISDAKYTLLSKANGNQHDYGHGDMLTHKDAISDHLPSVLAWYKTFTL